MALCSIAAGWVQGVDMLLGVQRCNMHTLVALPLPHSTFRQPSAILYESYINYEAVSASLCPTTL